MWQQDTFSDVDLAIRVLPEPVESAPCKTLQAFPAHRIILSNSPIFKAQMLRWATTSGDDKESATGTSQSSTSTPAPDGSGSIFAALHNMLKSEASPATAGDASNNSTSPSTPAAAAAKRQVVLTLQSESQQPAALAVLAAMYGVKPIRTLLSELSQEQQLDAAIVAGQLQLPVISAAAVAALVRVAMSAAGLSAAVIQHYLQLQVYSHMLLPLLPCVLAACTKPNSTAEQKAGVKHALLSVLGDLEEVWADAALRNTLLQLPLPAMELLLSYDELKVTSEDTVLYTAQAYIRSLAESRQKQAKKQLAPLVRCPHLSSLMLKVSAVSKDTNNLLLSKLQELVQKLLVYLDLTDNFTSLSVADRDMLLPGAPDSWTLPRRTIKPVSSVQVVWMVDVGDIRDALVRSTSKQKVHFLYSPDVVTPPIGGMAFRVSVDCKWDAEAQGAKLGLFAKPRHVAHDALYKASFSIAAGGLERSDTSPLMCASNSRGWPDYFDLGTMSSGWDAAAWAAKGLPSSGELQVTLTVMDVGHRK